MMNKRVLGRVLVTVFAIEWAAFVYLALSGLMDRYGALLVLGTMCANAALIAGIVVGVVLRRRG